MGHLVTGILAGSALLPVFLTEPMPALAFLMLACAALNPTSAIGQHSEATNTKDS